MPSTVPVKQDKRGVWYSRLYLGKDANGRKMQPKKSFPEAKSEAEAKMLAAEWAATLTADGKVRSTYLFDMLEYYIEMRAINGASPNSIKQYRQFNRCYVLRFLDSRRADELTPLDFTRFFGDLLRHGNQRADGLSPNTVISVYQFMRSAYKYFVTMGLVRSNPLLSAVKPSAEYTEAVALGDSDVSRLTDYIEPIITDEHEADDIERRNCMAVWLALHTGARCGEVCAIRGIDVNYERAYLHVGGTVVEPENGEPYRKEKPKSTTSRRNVSLVADELETIENFAKGLPSTLRSSGRTPIVTADGSWCRPSTISSWFHRLVKKLGLEPTATFHSLRHTHASWCLAHGIDVVTLSERLGHSSPTVTMRFYGHMMEGRDRDAAAIIFNALKEAR